MVNRGARDELARAIRRLAAGRVTNDQFADGVRHFVIGCADLGVQAIRLAAWQLYDDLHEHRLEGNYALAAVGRREVARWIVFLKSNTEYEWPNLYGWRWLILFLPNLLTVGIVGRFVRRWHDRHGDSSAWPFIRYEDLRRAVVSWPRAASR